MVQSTTKIGSISTNFINLVKTKTSFNAKNKIAEKKSSCSIDLFKKKNLCFWKFFLSVKKKREKSMQTYGKIV